jgi:hypothetical protein
MKDITDQVQIKTSETETSTVVTVSDPNSLNVVEVTAQVCWNLDISVFRDDNGDTYLRMGFGGRGLHKDVFLW